MMAAQEIIELFCELIAVRLPIIETQRLVVDSSFFCPSCMHGCMHVRILSLYNYVCILSL